MHFVSTTEIITKKVLNENTGELESKDFKQLRKKSKLRGGFKMTYKPYDDALIAIVKSNKDLEIIVYIRDLFTKNRVENVLSKNDIAEHLNVSPQKISSVIKKMIDVKLLKRISRGIYRLNPYMYLPYMSNGTELQEEWNLYDEK